MTTDEVCLACRRENAPRVDDCPFCSSCVEAGWDIAYLRGIKDFIRNVLNLAQRKKHAGAAPTYEVNVADAFAELRVKYGDLEAVRLIAAAQRAYAR